MYISDVNSIAIIVIYNGLHKLSRNRKSGITQNIPGLSDGQKIVRGLITADLKRHFSLAIQAPNSAVRTRGHTFKLKTTPYRLNIAQNLFFNRVVSAWNGLPQNIVNLESSLSFKKALRTVNFHSLITFDRHMQ